MCSVHGQTQGLNNLTDTHTDCNLSMLTDEHDQRELEIYFNSCSFSLTTFLVEKMLYFVEIQNAHQDSPIINALVEYFPNKHVSDH